MDVEDLNHVSSKYSPEFNVAGATWRIHIQQRTESTTQVNFLAVHLQCLTQDPLGTYAHFKLTVCNANPDAAKDKTFHCHFKKYGSAWGLHHFIQMDRLLAPTGGFIDYGPNDHDNSPGRRRHSAIVVDALIRVLLPQSDGTYAVSQLPFHSSGMPPSSASAVIGQAASAPVSARGIPSASQQPSNPPPAPLQFPYEDTLCDVTFALTGGHVAVRAHRCVIAARAPRLFPAEGQVPPGATVTVGAVPEVFKAFLKYLYTEETPERGVLRPEYLLDLYLTAVEHELFHLAENCITQVTPMLTYENILPIILSRYSATDDTLNTLYLRVLASGYDRLIEDEHFESLPGTLNRRLSLVMRGKEQLPPIVFPRPKGNLASHLVLLAESGAYSDFEFVLADNTTLKGHSVILASRSINFNHAFYQRAPVPSFNDKEYNFSSSAWQKALTAMYRGSLDPSTRDVTPEDVALLWKLTDAIGLDGRLRRESEVFVGQQTATRLLVLAEKHNVPKLREVALRMATATFVERQRAEPAVWDVVAELPQPALLALFRAVLEGGPR